VAIVFATRPRATIRLNEHQPRRMFDHAALQDLATSIRAHAPVLQPIVAGRDPCNPGR
jgi:ParB-like chromosome segregation protein Spo0J